MSKCLCVMKLVIDPAYWERLLYFLAENNAVQKTAKRLHNRLGNIGVRYFAEFFCERYNQGCYRSLDRILQLSPDRIPPNERMEFLAYCLWTHVVRRLSDNCHYDKEWYRSLAVFVERRNKISSRKSTL